MLYALLTHFAPLLYTEMATGFVLSEIEKHSLRMKLLLPNDPTDDDLRQHFDRCDLDCLVFLCQSSSARIRDAAQAYFGEQFKTKKISVKTENNRIQVCPTEPFVTYFRRSISHVTIHGTDPKTFDYVSSIWPQNLRTITFKDLLRQNVSGNCCTAIRYLHFNIAQG